MTFDIDSISNTFDIDIRYRRCKTSISNEHSISISSISNVTFDIEGPTLDIMIGVARMQMMTGIYQSYDMACHMTVVPVTGTSIPCHITGHDMVSSLSYYRRYIPCIYQSYDRYFMWGITCDIVTGCDEA